MAGFWIQIVGAKKTGKTSLAEDITRELVRRGRRVCYIKHTHEDGPTLDGEDTDTARARRAGASAAVLAGAGSTVVFRAPGGESLERVALRDSLPGEIVLAEGFKGSPGSKIVVTGGGLDVASLDGVIGVVGERPDGFDGPAFRADETGRLCDLIEATAAAAQGGDRWMTSLTVDGREVPLNAFVQDILASGVLGMSSALQNVEGGDAIELRCRRRRS
ncbi:MAG: molybdopterin-guanine dinucleotide biosynthesis protein B [Candidatus Eisenbacteria bacterium]|nr:molybdopterin-guanine dinucleotide biosynthesis protein B [Candidatus Eisenbacteria bacterium]